MERSAASGKNAGGQCDTAVLKLPFISLGYAAGQKYAVFLSAGLTVHTGKAGCCGRCRSDPGSLPGTKSLTGERGRGRQKKVVAGSASPLIRYHPVSIGKYNDYTEFCEAGRDCFTKPDRHSLSGGGIFPLAMLRRHLCGGGLCLCGIVGDKET